MTLASGIFAGCTANKKEAKATTKPTISVTIEPFHYFVDQIANGLVDVNVMVPAGNNPETYEPTPLQMVNLSKSILYLKVGHIGFEESWMDKMKENAPNMKVIDTSKGILPAKTASGAADPHTWMSITSARTIAKHIHDALCRQMPEAKPELDKNYLSFQKELDNTEASIDKLLSYKKAAFIIYHPILTYLARDYNIEQLPIEEEGREPSSRQMKDLILRAQREQIQTLFIQKEFANRNIQTFIEAVKAKPIEINPLSYDWSKQMVWIAQHLSYQQGKAGVLNKTTNN